MSKKEPLHIEIDPVIAEALGISNVSSLAMVVFDGMLFVRVKKRRKSSRTHKQDVDDASRNEE